MAVKTAKRILTGNTGARGTLDTDAVSKALMQYRNTPIKGTDASPAQLLLGRSLRDSVPQPPSSYKISNKWQQMLRQREKNMVQSAESSTEASTDRRILNELPVGSEVRVQNSDTKVWDRCGMVVESLPFRQYRVKIHGSGRSTIRNRVHLRPVLVFKPVNITNTKQPAASPAVSLLETTSKLSHPDLDATSSGSSNLPPSSKATSQDSARTGSPVIPRRSGRRRVSPDRYGDWTT